MQEVMEPAKHRNWWVQCGLKDTASTKQQRTCTYLGLAFRLDQSWPVGRHAATTTPDARWLGGATAWVLPWPDRLGWNSQTHSTSKQVQLSFENTVTIVCVFVCRGMCEEYNILWLYDWIFLRFHCIHYYWSCKVWRAHPCWWVTKLKRWLLLLSLWTVNIPSPHMSY